MKISYILPMFFLILIFFGCTESYEIKVKSNGQADVIYILSDAKKDSIKKSYSSDSEMQAAKDSMSVVYKNLFKSKLIKNYTCEINDEMEIKISYSIDNIDSLGQYLSPLSFQNIKFKLHKTKLVLDAGKGNAKAEDDIGGHSNLINFNLKIKLPNKIKSIKNESGLPINYSENTLTLASTQGALSYSGKQNKVTINF